MERGLTAETKALLISIGSAAIDPSLLTGELKTTATAGPGAGGSSFFIRSGSHRVRLSINPDSPLKVIPWKDGVAVKKEGNIIAFGTLERSLGTQPRIIIYLPRSLYDGMSENVQEFIMFCHSCTDSVFELSLIGE